MLGAPFGQAALGDEEVPAVAGPVASDRPALFLGRPRLPSESVALGVVALAVGLVEGYLLVRQEDSSTSSSSTSLRRLVVGSPSGKTNVLPSRDETMKQRLRFWGTPK